MPPFFPLCSDSLVIESGSEGDGPEGEKSTNKGLMMRSGGPKSLPPLPARPRSRSMDHTITDTPCETNLSKNQRQRAHSICFNPLLDCDLTPRGKFIASSWGNASFPVSILKNSTEKLHASSPLCNRKTTKVTFKDYDRSDYDTTSVKQDSTDSGNEDDYVPTDEESNMNSKKDNEENQDRGFCTVVHSFTPRPRPRGHIIRPATPMGLYESDNDVDEDITTDEDVDTLMKHFHRAKEPKARSKARGSASSSCSSSSSGSKKVNKPFRC